MSAEGLVVYSAIYGGWDDPKDVRGLGAPAVLYTDSTATARRAEAAGWVAWVDPLPRLPSPMLRAKWWKCHPRTACPGAQASVWIDGSLTPLDGFTGRVRDALDGFDVALTPHPWRDCIYDELEASVGLPKYEAGPMREQVRSYRLAGHPEHWGLFAAGCVARRHGPAALRLSEAWWAEITRWSWQDQLSLPVVLRRDARVRWNARLPWAEPLWGYRDHGSLV